MFCFIFPARLSFLWTGFVVRLFLISYLRSNKLGKQIHDSHQEWKWSTNENQSQISNGTKVAALRSWKINKGLAQNIDWKALDMNLSSLRHWERGASIKCLHRQWDTSLQKQKWNQSKTNVCAICEHCVESCDHVLKCQSPSIKILVKFTSMSLTLTLVNWGPSRC